MMKDRKIDESGLVTIDAGCLATVCGGATDAQKIAVRTSVRRRYGDSATVEDVECTTPAEYAVCAGTFTRETADGAVDHSFDAELTKNRVTYLSAYPEPPPG